MSRSFGGTSLTTRSPMRIVPAGDLLQARDHPQRRALAAAGRPDQDDELPVGDLQTYPIHGSNTVGVDLHHFFQDDFRHGASSPFPLGSDTPSQPFIRTAIIVEGYPASTPKMPRNRVAASHAPERMPIGAMHSGHSDIENASVTVYEPEASARASVAVHEPEASARVSVAVTSPKRQRGYPLQSLLLLFPTPDPRTLNPEP